MNIRHTAILLFALPVTALAQKEDDQIGNEVVNVVKPYTPTISDAFKVKETPPVEDPDNVRKTDVKYNIFSYPVASTFTPSKGRAASVDKTPQESLYRNFATVGIGNYGIAMAELFVTADVGENSYVGGMFRHLSSQGGIDALRNRIGRHIREALPANSAGVATALANGDQAGVTEADAEAMRR